MNSAEQIAAIIKAAKVAPRQVGAIIDHYKEAHFVKELRAGLPEAEFNIEVLPSPIKGDKKLKTIIIKRKVPQDPSAN